MKIIKINRNEKKYIILIVVLLLLILVVFYLPIKKKIFYIDGKIQEDYITIGLFSNEKNGINNLYEQDGRLTHKLNYKDNEPNGISEYYHINGSLKAKLEYINGKLLNILEYYDSCGRKLDYSSFRNSNGILRIYYDNGVLKEEGYIKNGLREGVWVDYLNSEDSTVKVETLYKNGHDENGFFSPTFF